MNNYFGFFKPWRKLPAQMFLLVILPFAILALAATLMSVGLHQNAMRVMVAERDLRAVETAAKFLESKIQAEQDVASVLAMQTDSSMTLKDFVAEHKFGSKNLALISEQGSLLAYSGNQEIKRSIGDLSIRQGIIQTLDVGGDLLLILSAKSRSGILALNIAPLKPLFQAVVGNSFSEKSESTAFLLTAQGKELIRLGSQTLDGEPTQHPGVAEALQGQSGFTYMSTATMEHVVAYSPVVLPGGALVIEEPWEMVDTPYLRLTQLAPLILIPLLAFTLVALWFGTTQVVVPLQKLEKRAADLAWGNFEAVESSVGGVQEIRQLQNELIHMARKVKDSQRSLRDYIGAITRGQEDERRRLARELHDETLQSLIALLQRVQLAQMKSEEQETKKALAELGTLCTSSIAELRRLTRALRPIYLEDFGLVTALEMLSRENSNDSFFVSFAQVGSECRLDPALELTLFRIAQEALSNVSRHSVATNSQVNLEFQPALVNLEIKDNGKGFTPPSSPAEFAPAGHYGLLGMYERTELMGGKLLIESSDAGTLIKVTLPA